MTFSIAARCADSGMFGVAVSSSSPAVAARCAFARSGVGAATSQNVTDPRLGPLILDAMEAGAGSREAVETTVRSTEHRDFRQLTAVDRHGTGWVFSGSGTLGTAAGSTGRNVACAGNLLADAGVPDAMTAAFENSTGHLADRLIGAMRAALDAGGEAGPVHSAGLLIVHKVPWPIIDLRVDWTEGRPIDQLDELWKRYQPQVDDYVTRALNPGNAPGYGVPGDERD